MLFCFTKEVVNIVNIVLTIEQHLCCYCAELIKKILQTQT